MDLKWRWQKLQLVNLEMADQLNLLDLNNTKEINCKRTVSEICETLTKDLMFLSLESWERRSRVVLKKYMRK
jgi:hypothetical protein